MQKNRERRSAPDAKCAAETAAVSALLAAVLGAAVYAGGTVQETRLPAAAQTAFSGASGSSSGTDASDPAQSAVTGASDGTGGKTYTPVDGIKGMNPAEYNQDSGLYGKLPEMKDISGKTVTYSAYYEDDDAVDSKADSWLAAAAYETEYTDSTVYSDGDSADAEITVYTGDSLLYSGTVRIQKTDWTYIMRDSLKGKKTGDTVTGGAAGTALDGDGLPSELADAYRNGTQIYWTAEIKDIVKTVTPELNDASVKKYLVPLYEKNYGETAPFSDTASFRSYLKEQLTEYADSYNRQSEQKAVTALAVSAASDYTVPDAAVAAYRKYSVEPACRKLAADAGLTEEKYAEQCGYGGFSDLAEAAAEEQVKTDAAVYAAAAEYGITVTDAQASELSGKYAALQAEANGTTEAEERKNLTECPEIMYSMILQDGLCKWAEKNCKMTEASVPMY